MKLVIKAGAIFDRLLGVGAFLAALMLTFATLVVCADVVMRYALNNPIIWTLDVCEYILVFMVSLAIAWLLKEEGHVKMDFLLLRFKPSYQALVNAITSALGAVALLSISWYGVQLILDFMSSGVVTERGVIILPKTVLLIPLDIGCFLLFVQLVRRSYGYFKVWRGR